MIYSKRDYKNQMRNDKKQIATEMSGEIQVLF